MLNPCKQCGAEAVEQIRGALRKGDPGYVELSMPSAETSNHPLNSEDFRVACTKCENATGWNKPNYTDYMRFVWNRDNPAPKEAPEPEPEPVAPKPLPRAEVKSYESRKEKIPLRKT